MPDNYDIGLPEFDVIDRKESSAGDYVYVLKLKDELKEQYKTCPQCGARMHVHKRSVRKIRDLNERGHNVGLAIQTARYRCSNKRCGYICSERVSIYRFWKDDYSFKRKYQRRCFSCTVQGSC